MLGVGLGSYREWEWKNFWGETTGEEGKTLSSFSWEGTLFRERFK